MNSSTNDPNLGDSRSAQSTQAGGPYAEETKRSHGLSLQREFVENADNLRRIFESIQDYAIFSYDRDHTITSWNPGVERVLGYGQDEFVGIKIDMIFDESDREIGIPNLEIEKALKEGFSLTEGIRVRKNGRRFWGSGVVRPLMNEAGEVYGFIKVLQDLTVRRQLEESLQEAKQIAEEANRAKDEFIAVLSHELRSPLTPISAALEGLEAEATSEYPSKETMVMFVDMIKRNLSLELRLVDDLLDVTRIARGKLAMKMESFDAHDKIEETYQMLRSDIEQKRQKFELNFRAIDHRIIADPARFQQIVWNLLRNASKFTPDEGTISIETYNDEDELVMKVRDTGIGMDAEGLARIFRPFVQGMPHIARMYGGLGLGLTIARALTETFGGRIFAASEGLGRGTTFTVILPVAKDVSDRGSRNLTDSQAKHRKAAKLLVIDDQTDARIALKALLELRGYKVDTAESIRSALICMDANQYDLVLSDIQLQGESGWDLPEQLPPGMKSIAVSALGTPANIETSMRAGFSAHITKPFRMNDLDRQIQELLGEPEHAPA